jgi:Transposase
MDHYVGIDVSLESASVCVIDATGRVAREAKVASEPAVLIAWFGSQGFAVTRIGLEAGPLSQGLYAALKEAGFAVELLETRHVCAIRALRPRCRRLVDLSSSNPIRWRPGADPGQKHGPGDRMTQKGIDQPTPVTEARKKRSVFRNNSVAKWGSWDDCALAGMIPSRTYSASATQRARRRFHVFS